MIKHIVMWRLLATANGHDQAHNAQQVKEKITALKDIVPGIIKLEIGVDISQGEMSADLVLYSEFESKEALAAYAKHPDHLEVVKFILSICSERHVVDYEC